MAITKSINKYGIDMSEAYWVIDRIDFTKYLDSPTSAPAGLVEGWDTDVYVLVFSSKEARDNEDRFIEKFNYQFKHDDASELSIQAEAYEYLKTLDEFQGGEDA